MGLLDEIKADANKKGISIGSAEERTVEQLLNNLFYLEKDIENETKFVKHVMTRGQETQERVGLHASSITKGTDADFCVRQQVLSLLFKQNQGENIPVKLKRIFEEGNAIHEKWQRLFIRNWYSEWNQCDQTCYNDEYMISYTPDMIAYIPEICEDDEIIIEVKSMNSWSYQKQATHAEGQKQLAWYLYLYGVKKGLVIAENKDTQEFRIEIVNYSEELVAPFIKRAEATKKSYNNFLYGMPLPMGHVDKQSKKCQQCSVRDACLNSGIGRVPINADVEELLKKRVQLRKGNNAKQ